MRADFGGSEQVVALALPTAPVNFAEAATAPSSKPQKHPITSPESRSTDSVLLGAPGSPWLASTFLNTKPHTSDFGFMAGEEPRPCAAFLDLRSQIAWDKKRQVKFIWTPDSERLVAPEEVPALFGDIFHREQLHRKDALQTTLYTNLGWVFLGVAYMFTDLAIGLFFVFAFTLLPAAQRLWSIRKGRSYSASEALEDAEQNRFIVWLDTHKSPLTSTLVAAISLIWLAQLASFLSHLGEAGWTPTTAAGLVKSAVWEGGEWSRLFTATVMHGPIWHILFNMLVLLGLGRIVEVVAGWYRFAIVFLISALLGSLFSLLLIPATSVGSSGGIMGLLGFMVVLGYLRPGTLPSGFARSILSSIGMIFLIGAVGFMIIDNAAHLGGLVAGALLGFAASKSAQPGSRGDMPSVPSRMLVLLGVVATAVLAATILGTLWVLFS